MFVSCMLYSKGQNAKPGQSGQKKYRKLQKTKRIPIGHGSLSLLSVACYQVDVFATGRSPVQRSSTDCGVSFFVI